MKPVGFWSEVITNCSGLLEPGGRLASRLFLFTDRKEKGFLTSGATSFSTPGQEAVAIQMKCLVVTVAVAGPTALVSSLLAVGGQDWCHPSSSLPLSRFPLYVCAESLEGENFCQKPRGSSTYFCKSGVLRPGNCLPTWSLLRGGWEHLPISLQHPTSTFTGHLLCTRLWGRTLSVQVEMNLASNSLYGGATHSDLQVTIRDAFGSHQQFGIRQD